MPVYVFKNMVTGELRRAEGPALNPAAEAAGILLVATPIPERPLARRIASPWMAWEAWDGSRCCWHADDNGDVRSGPRS